MADEHKFDRRYSDGNLQAIALRVAALETRMEVVEKGMRDNARELMANTVLTQQVHEAMFGRERADGEEDAGVCAKVKEMHEVFDDAKRGFHFLTVVADVLGKIWKPLAYLATFIAAIAVFVKTGQWKWPPL